MTSQVWDIHCMPYVASPWKPSYHWRPWGPARRLEAEHGPVQAAPCEGVMSCCQPEYVDAGDVIRHYGRWRPPDEEKAA